MRRTGVLFQVDFFFLAVTALLLADLSPLQGLLMLTPAFLHEGGHLLMLALLGRKPARIRFQIFGIGIEGGREGLTAGEEQMVLAAGPLTNFFCCFFFWLLPGRGDPEITRLLCLPHLALTRLKPRALCLVTRGIAAAFLRPAAFAVLRALRRGNCPLTALFCLLYLTACLLGP